MRIGLLASNSLSTFRLNTLTPILKDKSLSLELAIIDESPKKTLIKKLKKNLKRGRGGYIIVMAFQSLFAKKSISKSTEELCAENRIAVHKTKNLNSTESINIIRKYNLDVLLLIGGFGIIKEPLLSITRYGILSYHHGDMRKYRGMPPGLWEMYNGEKEMGVTVQILASGLDCGIPIEERTIPIQSNDTLKKLQKKAYNVSIYMMYNSIKKLSNKDFIPKSINKYGKIYTLPNLKQWIVLNIKILLRKLIFIFNSPTI